MRRFVALAAVGLVVAGCGGKNERLTVYAASSLTGVFQKLDPDARFDFAGSDELAFQIEQGAKADVYASASLRYTRELSAKGLARRPQILATNRLVLIVPRSNPGNVESLRGLMRPVKLVLAAHGVPAGDYAREVLARFCHARTPCPRARVVSEEHDVKGVVAKIALGEADAGFAYATDALAAEGKVRAIAIPTSLAPDVRYTIATLRDAAHPQGAEEFVRRALGQRGRAALRRAGFGLP